MNQNNKFELGVLSTFDLETLKDSVEYELEKRKRQPETLIKTIYFNDGSEGVYCKPENLQHINAEKLKEFLIQTIESGSDLRIYEIEMDLESYNESCARYEWDFNDEK